MAPIALSGLVTRSVSTRSAAPPRTSNFALAAASPWLVGASGVKGAGARGSSERASCGAVPAEMVT